MIVGGVAGNVYGFDLAELQPIANRIGFSPEDLGQDVSLEANPHADAEAKWWLSDYGITPTRK